MDEARRKHQERLRTALRKSLDELEIQRALHGVEVPIAIINSIAQKQAELHQVEAALSAAVSSEFAQALGADGQYMALTQEFKWLRQALGTAAVYEDGERRAGQRSRLWLEGVHIALLVGIFILLCYIALRLSL